ncbi:MAG: serine/threonine-protein kinase [Proteobacteria bacterium]|nr:serine/threonine-protein kinase [Pseudomonadota bacterium]
MPRARAPLNGMLPRGALHPGHTSSGGSMISATIGRYHILQELGRGGMGVVYKGHDPVLQRSVAIKILGQQLVGNPESKERFIREAQAAARLNHPNIAGIYDINEQDGIYYLVLEFIPGKNLDTILREHKGPMAVQEALKYFIPAAQALDYAHQHSIIHRDVKPANILVREGDEAVKVADFGIARVEAETSGLTQQNQLLGSLYYISPEQIRGEKPDRRLDIYALGIMLYEMLTGDLPFKADNAGQLMQLHLTAQPKPPTIFNLHIPRNVETAILKALAKDPAERFQNVQDLLNALKQEELPEEMFQTKISPAEAALHNILGNNYYKQGKLDLAILEWQKATALDPYNALTHNNLGTAFDGVGKLSEAVDEYTQAVKLNPNNFVAHYNLGSAHYRKGNLDESIEEYRVVSVLNPKFAPAYYNLGNGLYKQGKLDLAIEAWQKALILNPQFAEVLYNLGNAYQKKGRKEEAADCWKKALELDPQFAIAQYNLAAQALKEGDIETAYEMWSKSIEINPEFAEAHYNIGNLHYERGNIDIAITEWEKATHARYGFWQAHYNLGNAYYQREAIDQAVEQWQKTVQFKDNHWPAHWNLGNTYYFDKQQVDPAILEWQKVTTVKSDHWQSYYNLGEAYLAQGKLELTVLEWEKVVQLNPKFWHVYHNLGTIYYQRGKLDLAVAYWTKAVALMLFTW